MSGLTLMSWNINGARAIYKKGFNDWLDSAQPDILCLQETRAEQSQVPGPMAHPMGYSSWWNASVVKKGYSGTAIFSRIEPLGVEIELGSRKYDGEGRTIVAEFDEFYLLNCYFPNGGRDHGRVPFKLGFYEAFLRKCEKLRRTGKPVIFCGDVNTAHHPIDLARPQSNKNTTGFLPQERAWIDRVVRKGYVDSFRSSHEGQEGHYSWWSMPMRARERNVGWRIDYVFVSEELADRVEDAFILPEVQGSDHCPVGIRLR